MKRNLIILFLNFIIFTYSSYITNINKITFKEKIIAKNLNYPYNKSEI